MSIAIDASSVRKFSVRGSVVPEIMVCSLSDLQIPQNTFVSSVVSAFETLPFCAYDVARLVEEIIRENQPVLYTVNVDGWLELWDALFARPDPISEVKNFWKDVSNRDDVVMQIEAARPFRKRACWQFRLDSSGDYSWLIEPLGRPVFKQKTKDERSRSRRFTPLPQHLIANQDLQLFIGTVCQLVKQTGRVIPPSLSVTLHIMRTYAESSGRRPAPEGVHQDGADFIVSGLVVDRVNVKGGVSRIYYDRKGTLALEHELRVGEGVFQADNLQNYWHEITPIFPIDPSQLAYRSIVGLDIDFSENTRG